MPERKPKNFILGKAHFAAIASSYGEKMERCIKLNFTLAAMQWNFKQALS